MGGGPTLEKAMLGVPDRWMNCPKIGKLVGNRFLPFKTPLCNLYDDQIEKRKRFHPADVFNCREINGRKIGLWIDLTKTDRYYFVDEVTQTGCIYKKMPLAGHKATPSPQETESFIKLVNGHIRDHPTDLIAVHCTHGFNRTGFLIAAFIVTIQDWAVDAAILEFARQRPCGIYKQDYISDLFERYGDPEDVIEAPDRPQWELGEDLEFDESLIPSTSNGHENNGNGNNAGGDSKPSTSSGKVFMDGLVKNVHLLEDNSKKKVLRIRIKELCEYKRDDFPGLQPVSLEVSPERNNLQLLSQEEYMVSWKADGMRYMVYICDKDEVYAFDRDNEVFVIQNLSFPHVKEPRHIINTLVDAEMILEKVKENGRETVTPRLLIYDIIQYEDSPIRKKDFIARQRCIRENLIKPRNEAMSNGRLNRERQPMSVRCKDFWVLSSVPKLFEPKFTNNLGHEIDGLIFQPVKDPYVGGRCDKVLKWKPPSHNSIDFKLQIRKEKREGQLPEHIGYLYVQGLNEPMHKMKATRPLLPYNNKIIECSFDVQRREFVFMRERTDKSLPNGFRTAQAVFNSMMYPVNKEDIFRYVQTHPYRPPHHHHPHAVSSNGPPAKRAKD